MSVVIKLYAVYDLGIPRAIDYGVAGFRTIRERFKL